MKKFKLPCKFNTEVSSVTFYIGEAKNGNNPIQFQASWLSRERGGVVPDKIMQSLEELKALSEKNAVPFEDLLSYAIESIQTAQSLEKTQSTTKEVEKKYKELNKNTSKKM
jgi:hypothetical protein